MSNRYAPPPANYQIGLFDGDLHDTRSDKQKRSARLLAAPRQLAMFDSRATYEQMQTRLPVGAPLNGRGQPVALALMMQDPRSREEVEAGLMQAAQEQTYSLFGRVRE